MQQLPFHPSPILPTNITCKQCGFCDANYFSILYYLIVMQRELICTQNLLSKHVMCSPG